MYASCCLAPRYTHPSFARLRGGFYLEHHAFKWLRIVLLSCIVVMGIVWSSAPHLVSPPTSPSTHLTSHQKNSISLYDTTVTQEVAIRTARSQLRALFSPSVASHTRKSVMHAWLLRHPTFEKIAWMSVSSPASPLVVEQLEEQTSPPVIVEWNTALARMNRSFPAYTRLSNTHTIIGIATKKERIIALLNTRWVSRLQGWQSSQLRYGENIVQQQIDGQPNQLTPYFVHPPQHVPRNKRTLSMQSGTQKSHYVAQEVIVKFLTPLRLTQRQAILKKLDATTIHLQDEAYVFRSKTKTTTEMVAFFRRYGVHYVEPHYWYVTNAHGMSRSSPAIGDALPEKPSEVAENTMSPNDELYAPYQWNLEKIRTEIGWSYTKGSKAIIVAIIDTGVSLDHPDLKGRLVPGYNVINPTAPPWDDVGHGTHVAGIVAASTNNTVGIAGMTWATKVMPIKVLDDQGAGNTASVAEGIIWATDHGAQIINLSLGNYAGSAWLHEAIRYAFDHDVVLIAATGNDNSTQLGYPAAYDEVFAVSAIDEGGQRASFANYGGYVDVVAPGEHITSTYPGGQYATLSGTSMASPHVAALAALIRSRAPHLSNRHVYDRMRHTAQDLGEKGKDQIFGYGLIDVARALHPNQEHVLVTPSPPKKVSESASLPPRPAVPWYTKWWDIVLHTVLRTLKPS